MVLGYERHSAIEIPDYHTIMLSLLEYSGDDEEHSVRETVESLDELELFEPTISLRNDFCLDSLSARSNLEI